VDHVEELQTWVLFWEHGMPGDEVPKGDPAIHAARVLTQLRAYKMLCTAYRIGNDLMASRALDLLEEGQRP